MGCLGLGLSETPIDMHGLGLTALNLARVVFRCYEKKARLQTRVASMLGQGMEGIGDRELKHEPCLDPKLLVSFYLGISANRGSL